MLIFIRLSFFIIRTRAHLFIISILFSNRFFLLLIELRVEFWVGHKFSHLFIVFINVLVANLIIWLLFLFPFNELKDSICNYAFVAIGYIYLSVVGIVDAVGLLLVVG